MRSSCAVLAVALLGCRAILGAERDPNEPRVFYDQSQRPGEIGLDDFERSDPAAWRVAWEQGDYVLELFAPSEWSPPYRAPSNVALIGPFRYGDFTLDVDARQTGREYAHRDLCLFFGWEGASRFYYAHLASTPDANAHNVFLVDGADRRNLLPPQPHGIVWGDAWHHLRLERRMADGLIRVYFDDMTVPVLEAHDTTLGFGRVGFGSFDDTGRFRNAQIRAVKVAPSPHGLPPEEPFRR